VAHFHRDVADVSDTSQVEAAVVSLLGTILYPNGPAAPSVIGYHVNIERGWPTEADIRFAGQKQQVLVRVYGVSGLSRDVTRYPRDWMDYPNPTLTLTATLGVNLGTLVEGSSPYPPLITGGGQPISLGGGSANFNIVFGGVPALGQYVGVILDRGAYAAHPVTATDALEDIAAGIASQIAGAAASGPSVSLPTGLILTPVVNLASSGPSAMEVGRDSQMFTVASWSPSPQLRDALMQTIYPYLAYTYRLTLPNGGQATLMNISSTGPEDVTSRAGEWRRDLRLDYNYPLTISQIVPPVVVPVLNISSEF
jgi:hypothetical protein